MASQLIHDADHDLIDFFQGIRLGRDISDLGYDYTKICTVAIAGPLYGHLLPKLCATGRLAWIKNRSGIEDDRQTLSWDTGEPWRFETKLSRDETKQTWQLDGFLLRGGERKNISEPKLLLADGVVMFDSTIGLLDAESSFKWISLLRQNGPLQIPFSEQDDFVEHILVTSMALPIALPAEMQWQVLRPIPQPVLCLRAHEDGLVLGGQVSFDYNGEKILFQNNKTSISDRPQRRLLLRQNTLEQQHMVDLFTAGGRVASWNTRRDGYDIELPPARLPSFVPKLFDKGWIVTAEGRPIRQSTQFSLSVSSGIDWFDMSVDLHFDESSLALPRLLAALRNGDRFVTLDDGTLGMLPEDWLARFTPFGRLGEVTGDKIR